MARNQNLGVLDMRGVLPLDFVQLSEFSLDRNGLALLIENYGRETSFNFF